MLQPIKKDFFAFRNGIVAQRLRDAGDPHHIIMGCQLADVTAIAAHYEKNVVLAQALWGEVQHRECRLAASMLYPVEEMTIYTALAWCRNVESEEEADVLCHRLLRHLPCATQLWQQLHKSPQPLVKYTAWRLLLNLLLMGKTEITSEMQSLVAKEIHNTPAPSQQVLKSIAIEIALAL